MATIATNAGLEYGQVENIQAEVRADHRNAARTANHGSGETREDAGRKIKALKASSERTT